MGLGKIKLYFIVLSTPCIYTKYPWLRNTDLRYIQGKCKVVFFNETCNFQHIH